MICLSVFIWTMAQHASKGAWGVYGRFVHKDDPLQVSRGRRAPTISSMSHVKHQIIVYTLLSYVSSVLFYLQYSKYDFVNTLYAIFPQMYVVNCDLCNLFICIFSQIRCWNKIRVNKLCGGPVTSYMKPAAISRQKGQAQSASNKLSHWSGSSCRN